MKILFIHRSVGHHLIEFGKLRTLLNEKEILFDDYDNNLGQLTHYDDQLAKNLLEIPGNNTNPENLAALFDDWPALLNEYDMIMIKSCYPNSHIANPDHLEKIKNQYIRIVKVFATQNKRLLILTTPPLRSLFTNQNEAQLASELADWLVSLDQSNLTVFDYHHKLAGTSGKIWEC